MALRSESLAPMIEPPDQNQLLLPPSKNTPGTDGKLGVAKQKQGRKRKGRDGASRKQQREKPPVHNLIEGILSE